LAPLRVAVIDLDRSLGDIDCTRSKRPPYGGAWILACRSGRPVGVVEIPLRGTRISVAELEHALRDQLKGQRPSEPRDPGPPALPFASVVVPTTFSRPDRLRRCMECLSALDYPEHEVIVVDNRAGDRASFELQGARVVRETRPGASAARNRGLAEARGEIVAFTDDDVEVDSGWLRAIVQRFVRHSNTAVVTGLVVPRELETPAQILFERSGGGPAHGCQPLTFERAGRFRVLRHSAEDGSVRCHSLYVTGELGQTANLAVRSAVLREAGGFDLALGIGTPTYGGEDLALLLELIARGYDVAYEPTAMVFHNHRASFDELERQIYGYGVGFSAMLTAITLRNPWHLIGFAASAPAWVRSLHDATSPKYGSRTADYPRSLIRARRRGTLLGPIAYLYSRFIWKHIAS
jgi:GT2 family glycosyltransferase